MLTAAWWVSQSWVYDTRIMLSEIANKFLKAKIDYPEAPEEAQASLKEPSDHFLNDLTLKMVQGKKDKDRLIPRLSTAACHYLLQGNQEEK